MRVKIKEIILSFRKNNNDPKLIAEDLGVHRSTVYRWLKRARSYRNHLIFKQLRRKSTRPKTICRSLDFDQGFKIIQFRKRYGFTAAKIKVSMGLTVSTSTIHRFLIKQKLVRKYGNYRRPRFQNTIHMHAKNVTNIGFLQMDVKYITPELSGLPWTCFEYAVIDIYSRYKEAVILNQLDADGAIIALMEIIKRLPFKPIFIQTDNGLEFQNKFDKFCQDIGLKHHWIHKRTPNENAVIERSFRTDQDEFFFNLKEPLSDYDQLRRQFADYLDWYNKVRPHFGVNLKTPFQVIINQLSQMS